MAQPVMRILIVDDEAGVRFTLDRALRRSGMETVSANTVHQAIERLRSEAFDVVVTDLQMPGGDGTALVQWLGSYSPSTRVIIISGFISPELQRTYENSTELRLLEKPVDTQALVRAVEEFGPRKGFYGNAIEVELFDYVQLIALSGRDKLIEVQTPGGTGMIWFEHGDIVHCEYGDLRGEPAFYRLVAGNRGTYKEVFNQPAPARTVTRSSTHLLMEAARQSDESTLGARRGDNEIDLLGGNAAALPTLEETQPRQSTMGPVARDQPAAAVDRTDSIEILFDQDAVSPSSAHEQRDPAPAAPLPEPPGPPAQGPTVDESSFADLNDAAHHRDATDSHATGEIAQVVPIRRSGPGQPTPSPPTSQPKSPRPGIFVEPSGADATGKTGIVMGPAHEEVSASISTGGGHSIFDDPETRRALLEQFWEFEGVNGVAIISSTGKVLAEDMGDDSSLVTLAGFYMRGAARIARALGYNVFDGVVARSRTGQQMVMISMGAASAVLSVDPATDPDAVRVAVLGAE